jgi:hypothetical protein
MKFNQLIFSPYIGDGSPVDQSLWIDDLAISTEIPMNDLSPLAPRKLRVEP